MTRKQAWGLCVKYAAIAGIQRIAKRMILYFPDQLFATCLRYQKRMARLRQRLRELKKFQGVMEDREVFTSMVSQYL